MKKSLLLISLLTSIGCAMANEPLELRAAGSLKAAMGDIVQAFEKDRGQTVVAQFGPSGLLRERIESGEKVDLFASANMKHPQTLMAKGMGDKVQPFARNQLCALAQPEISLTPATLLERMLSADVRVGTSTPKADPSGDYAFRVFELAETVTPGAEARLKTKALQLTGGPNSAKPPKGVNPYAHVMKTRQADIFLTYCTNGRLASKEYAELQLVPLPDNLAVGADYGLLVIDGRARALADYILSPAGQAILSDYGFAAPR
ncbi:molybdate ABC transporter substrate-binding protein [Shewanella litorisediminis]|uniref:Molybdate ABC transporter substrate-binding protein n=2 Tax=Shewanella litorisediminis TaxID=1173586 RepID=A0ABX7G1X3_9GAMM|nr:molybdate ABC transporter substrate-binding protein [Shewanella litorisediminis]